MDRTAFVAGFVLLIACNDHPLKNVELSVEQRPELTYCMPHLPRLDVLLVIDGSRSMLEEQAQVGRVIDSIADVYTRDAAGLDVRLAVVDGSSNTTCSPVESRGVFVDESCSSRPEDFVTEDHDVFDEACPAFCTSPPPVAPTSAQGSEPAKQQPWIEFNPWGGNVEHGAPADLLRCWAPQGIAGCGLESPLEAMYAALIRAATAEDEQWGFLRHDAGLLVVFVTDESDCSTNKDRYLSAAECADAAVGESEDLRPLSRYVDLLQDLADRKWGYNPAAEVYVSVIAGVHDGGPPSRVTERDLAEFGGPPVCISDHARAYAPRRLEKLAAEFPVAGNGVFSICEADIGTDFLACEPAWFEEGPCYRGCPADADHEAPGLQADCRVTVTRDGGEHDVSSCADSPTEFCYVLHDEPQCDSGLELELRSPLGPPPCVKFWCRDEPAGCF